MDGLFDEDYWTYVGVTSVDIARTGSSGTEPAIHMKRDVGRLELYWQTHPEVDLRKAWQDNANLLSYDLQVKVSPYDVSDARAYSSHYMLGLSFRLYQDTETSYGVSFFRSRMYEPSRNPKKPPRELKPPDWLPPALEPLRGTNVYIILWCRTAAGFDLINYRTLDGSHNMTYVADGVYELRDYVTMLVELDEFIDNSGVRQNNIVVYMQNPDIYPNWNDTGDARWGGDPVVFPSPITWENPAVIRHIDGRITSENFAVDSPSEVAVHFFYHKKGPNKKFFDDFMFRQEGYVNPLAASTEIQY
jgi:hypothetical protein